MRLFNIYGDTADKFHLLRMLLIQNEIRTNKPYKQRKRYRDFIHVVLLKFIKFLLKKK